MTKMARCKELPKLLQRLCTLTHYALHHHEARSDAANEEGKQEASHAKNHQCEDTLMAIGRYGVAGSLKLSQSPVISQAVEVCGVHIIAVVLVYPRIHAILLADTPKEDPQAGRLADRQSCINRHTDRQSFIPPVGFDDVRDLRFRFSLLFPVVVVPKILIFDMQTSWQPDRNHCQLTFVEFKHSNVICRLVPIWPCAIPS